MGSYTPGFNFYLAKVDDSNKEYVPGFTRNFETIDVLLKNLVSQSITDPYANDEKLLKRKRVVSDEITSYYQSHADSFTNTENGTRINSGLTYRMNIMENPHGITPDQLYFRDDIKAGETHEVFSPIVTSEGVIEYNPFKNMGHNSIISEINNMNNTIVVNVGGTDVIRNRDLQIKGYGVTYNTILGAVRPVIDYSELYIQDIGGSDSKKYRNHKYIYVDIENQIKTGYTSDNVVRNKHVSDSDVKHFETHIQNIGVFTSAETKVTFPEMMINGQINSNPHRVTASDLYDKDSASTDTIYRGKNAIIKEINKQAYNNVNVSHEKIYWDLIDKNNIDGNGNSANITDIPVRNHDDLQNINILDVASNDTVKNKHLSNAQSKKWEDHVNTELLNPHKTKAVQLYTNNNVLNGTLAIIEQINKDYDIGTSGYDNSKILWNAIDKNNIDGNGNSANITDIPVRNHDDLQNINILDINTSDMNKNKHVSSMQLNSLFQYGNVIENSNIHRITARSLIGEEITPITNADKQNIHLIYHTEGKSVYIDVPFMQNDDDLYVECSFKTNLITSPNIDMYFNKYYLGQTDNVAIKTFIIPKAYITSNNSKFIFYWNTGTVVENVLNYLKIYQKKTEHGRNAIIDEINRNNTVEEDTSGIENKKILWSKINKDDSSLSELTNKYHWDLSSVNGYDLENDPSDITDSKSKRNKHISYNDGQAWQKHIDTKDGSNPHKLQIENINSTLGRVGALAAIDCLNNLASNQAPPSNIGTDQTKDNYLVWNLISKKSANITDIPNRSHQSLQDILPIDFISTNSDTNKHVSNIQAKKWEDHVNSISVVGEGSVQVNKWKNPHKLVAASLYSHKNYSGFDNTYNGGNAIIDAINDYGNMTTIQWNRINKLGSNLTDISTRNHNDLQNIKYPDNTLYTTKSEYTLHISQNEYNDWENHRKNVDNPHELCAHQIKNLDNSITPGANSIIAEINQHFTTKINHTVIDLNGNDEKGILPFNIANIPLKNHNDLTNGSFVVDGTGASNVFGHIRNSQVKKWDDHVANTVNPHKTTADQIPLGVTKEELLQNGIKGENLKDVILEVDEFRNRINAGLINIPRKDTDLLYYFDNDYNLYVPECEVYLNNKTGFSGKIQRYKTPITSSIAKPAEIEFDKFYKIPLSSLPKNRRFHIYAKLVNGSVIISVEQGSTVTELTDGQSVVLLTGFLKTRNSDTVSPISEAFCYPPTNTALGLTEKMFNRIMFTEPLGRQSGLSLKPDSTESNPGLFFSISAGSVWEGMKLVYTEAFYSKNNTTSSGVYSVAYRQPKTLSDETWSWIYETNHTTAINSSYQLPDGGLGTLPDGKIVCNFVYYDIVFKKVYVLLSEDPIDTIDQFDKIANQLFPSEIPFHIRENAILVGILLCKKGDNNNFARIYSSFDILFTNTTTDTSITDHTQLSNLNSYTYRHLTKPEYDKLDFIFTDIVTDNETGFDRAISKAIINKRITQILTDGSADASVDTILKIANVAFNNHNNKVDKSGGTMTGELILKNIGSSVNVLSILSNGSAQASMFIGSNINANKNKGFWLAYDKATTTIHLVSQNSTSNQEWNNSGNLEILSISEGGNFTLNTDAVLKNTVINEYVKINNGLLKTEDISLNNESNKFGLILGNTVNQGTILFRHHVAQASTIFRVKDQQFRIDTYDGLYINTDLSRPEKTTQDNPASPVGLKYIDPVSKNGIYDVYIGNIGTQDSPIYPIKLHPSGKSQIINGLHIGNGSDYLSDTTSIFSVTGNINLNNNMLLNVDTIKMKTATINNISGIINIKSADTGNTIIKYLNGVTEVLGLMVDANSASYSIKGKTGIKIGEYSTELLYNNVVKLQTTEYGINIIGDIKSNNIKLALETINISAGIGLSGGGTLSSDITIDLNAATNSTLGGVIVDNETIKSVDGLITAKSLKDEKFTMKYDATIGGIVISFI